VQDPETLRLLVETWSTMLPRLLKEALKMTRAVADAEDLVQETYLAVAQGSRRWYPRTCPDFYWFVHGTMRSLWSHDTRDAALHASVQFEPGEPGSAQLASTISDPEGLGILKQSAEHRAGLRRTLRFMVANDPLAAAIVDLPDEAEDENTAELATRLGVDKDDVERAWDRVRYAAAKMARGRRMLRVVGPDEDAQALATLAARGVDIEAVRAKMRTVLEREGAFAKVAKAQRRRRIVNASVAYGAVALMMALAITECVR
jgi:RNA polymerase sigma-70 factor (ECF subfamily)